MYWDKQEMLLTPTFSNNSLTKNEKYKLKKRSWMPFN